VNLSRVLALKTSPLERQIEYAKLQFLHAATPQLRREWLRTFEELIKRRSPERIIEMEKEKGLRK
jgi:hypothetical protein